jgi:hypothetical protein
MVGGFLLLQQRKVRNVLLGSDVTRPISWSVHDSLQRGPVSEWKEKERRGKRQGEFFFLGSFILSLQVVVKFALSFKLTSLQ